MIEHDGRDNWLSFYKENGVGKFLEIDKTMSHPMTNHEVLKHCESWLSGLTHSPLQLIDLSPHTQ